MRATCLKLISLLDSFFPVFVIGSKYAAHTTLLSKNNAARRLALSHRRHSQRHLGSTGPQSLFLPENSPAILCVMMCFEIQQKPCFHNHQGSHWALPRDCWQQVGDRGRGRARSREGRASAGCTSGGSWQTQHIQQNWSPRLTLPPGKKVRLVESRFGSPSSSRSVPPSMIPVQASFVHLRGRISPTCIA